ncbi:hypothetical protein CLI75_10250 [Porphyromonas gingivalis]|uniref:DUF3408 domain-containing protein n=1 Tax=Porphyromonas gingivalis TaxID=837 RepID=UPI000BE765E2|nr:DUF3408 domain-containing protein [Porphyromonas gingivalis]PDP55307.1 hypothetical protein CLI75_10250 [Porphyromonas gingivalis]RZQ69101.1 DUF3408 domain-containing protein [Porphyromonas gingivalis]
MKEGFDISHYLNSESSQILSRNITRTFSEQQERIQAEKSEQSEQSESSLHPPVSEQKMPSEPLNKVKEVEKAELSEQEKQQVASSTPRRISHKQWQKSLENYREAFLSPHKIIDRKATYLSRSTWEHLEFVVRRLGDYGANVSSFLECIALQHLEEYGDDIEHWRKL